MFNIEFYSLPNGEKPVQQFLDSLDNKMRAKALYSLSILSEYGNALREPYSKALGDGLFELVLIRQPSSPLELEGILRSLRMKDPNSSLVSFRRGRHISVTQEGELNWVVDGNLLVTKDSYDIEILPSRIDLIC